ncbi:hypothetical protein GOV05_04685 [Candidatus Woesearchaeota archaeon]|nr:hypothetical protein [Candidatus Woesearchaeota archaeon]
MIKALKYLGVASTIFVLSMIIIAIPILTIVSAANNTQNYFNVSVVISNSPPTMGSVATTSAMPQELTTTTAYILFNVSDTNGYTDIDPAQSYANITRGGVTIESSSCANYAAWSGGIIRGVNCTITLNYNNEPGPWSISVRAQDGTPSIVYQNDANNFTYGSLYAFKLEKSSISFSSAGAGVNDVNSSNDPQILNNTGNGNFTYINITAYELSNGAGAYIGQGNFTINATNDAKGLSLGSMITIPSAVLNRNTTQDLYVWMDIPSGLANGTYTTNSSTQWLIEAYN